MNRTRCSIGSLFAAAAVVAVLGAAPVAAHAADMPAKPDCATAPSAMMMPGPAAAEMKSSGDVDKDFARAMSMRMDEMMSAAKLEMACGKDAKTKKFAQDSIEKQRAELTQLRLLIGVGG